MGFDEFSGDGLCALAGRFELKDRRREIADGAKQINIKLEDDEKTGIYSGCGWGGGGGDVIAWGNFGGGG